MRTADKVILSGTFTTDQFSRAIPIDQMFGYSVQAKYSGTAPVGVLTVQGTNDDALNALVTPTWSDEQSPIAIAAAGDTMINFQGRFYRFFRVKLTVTSGTIVITVRFHDKGI